MLPIGTMGAPLLRLPILGSEETPRKHLLATR